MSWSRKGSGVSKPLIPRPSDSISADLIIYIRTVDRQVDAWPWNFPHCHVPNRCAFMCVAPWEDKAFLRLFGALSYHGDVILYCTVWESALRLRYTLQMTPLLLPVVFNFISNIKYVSKLVHVLTSNTINFNELMNEWYI